MQLRGRIDPGAAPSNGSETLRFVQREIFGRTAFVPTNVVRIPKRSFRKEAKVPPSPRRNAEGLPPTARISWPHKRSAIVKAGKGEYFMDTIPARSLNFTGEELMVLRQILEAEQARMLVEIRHTDHRSFRDELRRRLETVEHLVDQCRAQ